MTSSGAGTASRASTLRRVGPADAACLFEWRNRADVVALSETGRAVFWPEHLRWLAEVLAGHEEAWIVEVDGTAAGYVRLTGRGSAPLRIAIVLLPEYRGQGLGPEVIRRVSAGLRVEAVILNGNEASRRAFAKAGYRCLKEVWAFP